MLKKKGSERRKSKLLHKLNKMKELSSRKRSSKIRKLEFKRIKLRSPG